MASKPDGIYAKVWARAAPIVGETLRNVFTKCLQERPFPRKWKRARLVLLKKEGKPTKSLSAYRPLYMMQASYSSVSLRTASSGTCPEKVSICPPANIASREARSTIDAILNVRFFSGAITGNGKVALAVSLDIANAFNSIPWAKVVKALDEYYLVFQYHVSIIRDYFRDRKLEFRNKTGLQLRRDMSYGVSQWSVLSPLL